MAWPLRSSTSGYTHSFTSCKLHQLLLQPCNAAHPAAACQVPVRLSCLPLYLSCCCCCCNCCCCLCVSHAYPLAPVLLLLLLQLLLLQLLLLLRAV
jgi:hypothetical protein